MHAPAAVNTNRTKTTAAALIQSVTSTQINRSQQCRVSEKTKK